ncbi:MAG: siderophore-interacting protein [Actinobacteria bacterium]|nr:siderophore-interacting protein [Actinomycetota bacterium]
MSADQPGGDVAGEAAPGPIRLRREPPRFRQVEVRRTGRLGPRMARVVVGGPAFEGFGVDEPAASVRVLIPSPGDDGLLLPAWDGNEFLRPDGSRPIIRTLTPRAFDPATLELAVDVVLHEGGPLAAWARSTEPGTEVAVSGPGRGSPVPEDASGFLLAGDETALPAISQLLEALPGAHPVEVHVEVAEPSGRLALPDHPSATVTWHDASPGAAPGDAFVNAVRHARIPAGTWVWAAGEAAAVQRLRRLLFDERGLARSAAWIRGYWKLGRAEGASATG